MPHWKKKRHSQSGGSCSIRLIRCIYFEIWGGGGTDCPTNIGTSRATTRTATPLVVISDGGQSLAALGCSKGAFHSLSLTAALALGQPITKCTLATLVGWLLMPTVIMDASTGHVIP